MEVIYTIQGKAPCEKKGTASGRKKKPRAKHQEHNEGFSESSTMSSMDAFTVKANLVQSRH